MTLSISVLSAVIAIKLATASFAVTGTDDLSAGHPVVAATGTFCLPDVIPQTAMPVAVTIGKPIRKPGPSCKPLTRQPDGPPLFSGTFEITYVRPICRMAPCPPYVVFRTGKTMISRACGVSFSPPGEVPKQILRSRSTRQTVEGELWITNNTAFVKVHPVNKGKNK